MQWFIFSLLIVALAYLATKVSKIKKYRYLLLVALALVMAVVVGFGGIESKDHDGYVMLYNNLIHGKLSDFGFGLGRMDGSFEWGYTAVNYLAMYLGLGEAGFFTLVAFITNFFILLVMFRESKHFVFSCFLFILSFFYMQEPNLVRQSLAAAFALFSLRYLDNNKIKLFLLFVFLSGLMHVSGFFFVLFLPLSRLNFEKHRTHVLLVLISLWAISLLYLYGFLHSDFLEAANIFRQMSLGEKLTGVSDSEFIRSILNDIMNLLLLLIFIYYLFVNQKAKLNVWVVLLVLGPVCYNMGENSYSLFRFACYFLPLMPILIPNFLYEFKLSKNDNTHFLYYIYVLWNISILIRSHIMSDAPLFFNEMYSLKDFFA